MPGMTDRDHFAAAALTGLLASREWPIDSDEASHYCYRVADAMLRERDRTNHDAAPAARASVESVAPQPTTRGDSDRTDKAAPRPSAGTGDTQEPVAWVVCTPGDGDWSPCFFHEPHAQRHASAILGSKNIVQLYRKTTLTDAEREALLTVRDIYAASGDDSCVRIADAIDGLLARLGGGE